MRLLAMKRYELTAEVYTHSFVQNESGAIVSVWDYANPRIIRCKARSVRPWGSVEDFGTEYTNKEYLEIQAESPIALADRVGRIRNRTGDVLWKVDSGSPMVFNVSGCSPSVDPNGRTVDYRILCEKVEVNPF